MTNDSIDFNDVWWSDGQDNFVLANDVQVPLYGLMEPVWGFCSLWNSFSWQ